MKSDSGEIDALRSPSGYGGICPVCSTKIDVPDCDALDELYETWEQRIRYECRDRTASPAQPPDEALGADEIAREIARTFSYQFLGEEGQGDLEHAIAAAIHAAEQRVRREDAEIAATAVSGLSEDFTRMAAMNAVESAILARLGGPERR